MLWKGNFTELFWSKFQGLSINRYQLSRLPDCFLSTCRILNVEIGERSRLAWLGVEADPLAQSDNLLKAYNRNSEAAADRPASNWFRSKNAIISGLGLLGIKQGNGESETTPKARRKRVVKRKITTSAASWFLLGCSCLPPRNNFLIRDDFRCSHPRSA